MEIKDTSKNTSLCENNKLYGSVTYKMYDKDHNLVETKTVPNNIVLGIRMPIIELLGGWATDPSRLPFVKQVILGTSSVPPAVDQTDVQEPIPNSQKNTSNATLNTDGPSVTFSFMYDANDANVDGIEIHEMGLYTSDNRMVARTTVGTWKKIAGLYFEIYWTIGYQPNTNN